MVRPHNPYPRANVTEATARGAIGRCPVVLRALFRVREAFMRGRARTFTFSPPML
jgi:hypothetical protein